MQQLRSKLDKVSFETQVRVNALLVKMGIRPMPLTKATLRHIDAATNLVLMTTNTSTRELMNIHLLILEEARGGR